MLTLPTLIGTYESKIEERRKEGREDILSDLVVARLDGVEPLNVAEMLSILQQFLVAGNETTANLIASAVMLLIQHPEQQKLVRDDPSLLPNMVDEALRLESPVQTLFRMAKCDTEVGGVAIPKGARIAVSYAAANRDPVMCSAKRYTAPWRRRYNAVNASASPPAIRCSSS